MRCLLEGTSEEDILQNWHSILPDRMHRWHLDRQEVCQSIPSERLRTILQSSLLSYKVMPAPQWPSAFSKSLGTSLPESSLRCMHRNVQRHCPRSFAVQLVELFGSTRDAWMADNLDDWLAANKIYQGVPAIVQHLRSQGPFYIVTTKQVRCRKASLALINGSKTVALLLTALRIAHRHLLTMQCGPLASWRHQMWVLCRRASRRP